MRSLRSAICGVGPLRSAGPLRRRALTLRPDFLNLAAPSCAERKPTVSRQRLFKAPARPRGSEPPDVFRR
ncbi:hypothetical protein EVAR_88648_1 [Eumeta japonica]|uniref:Uncharacterized protein n=1 Tax=Eumeta variegata TaxID=151549 RepID=A0A4C1YA57_EUMVA|nr:hypothetical protein EVAR_88648_1 [Eumeta japonica]